MTTLIIDRKLYQALLAHLHSLLPMEGCGLLAGKNGRIHKQYPIDNRLNSPAAFEMEPEQLVTAVLELEAAGHSLLAIYHSHPQGPPAPSPTDIAQANYPEVIQLIVSFHNPNQPEGRAFQIENGRVSPITLKIV